MSKDGWRDNRPDWVDAIDEQLAKYSQLVLGLTDNQINDEWRRVLPKQACPEYDMFKARNQLVMGVEREVSLLVSEVVFDPTLPDQSKFEVALDRIAGLIGRPEKGAP